MTMDAGGEANSVQSQLLLKSTPFHQGEYVYAHFTGGFRLAQVLQVDYRANRFFIHYKGFNKKWDEWVGVERLMKYNKQIQKEIPLKKITQSKPKNPNVKSGKKRKTMSKGGMNEGWAENEFVTPVVNAPLTMVRNPGVKIGAPIAFIPHWSLTNDADLLDPKNAYDFMAHVQPPRTRTRLMAMSEMEFLKNYDSIAVNNLMYMVEMKKRYCASKANEIEVKEELMRCKAAMALHVKNFGVVSEGNVGLKKELEDARGKVKKMVVDRAGYMKERAALRAGKLELLGRVREAEGETAALKKENVELLKKLVEAEGKRLSRELKLTRDDVVDSDKRA